MQGLSVQDRIEKLDPLEFKPMRIVQFLPPGSGWTDINPLAINKGVGGRETAAIKLGEQFAKQGHYVTTLSESETVFYKEYESGGTLEYMDSRCALSFLQFRWHDVILSWEYPEIFGWEGAVENSGIRIVGMQCAHLNYDISPYYQNITAYVCLSDWAKHFLPFSLLAPVSLDDIHIIPNGIDLSRYGDVPNDTHNKRKSRNQFIYSSSPDRGLVHLLEMWPKIKSLLPDATLHVGYGADRWLGHAKWSHSVDGDMAVRILRGMKQPDIINRGLMGQDELAYTQLQSSLLLYPCDTTQPTETGCITITEGLAAKLPVITTDCDCLGSEYSDVTSMIGLTSPFDKNLYIEVMMDVLNNADTYDDLQTRGRRFAEQRTWERTSIEWLSLMNKLTLSSHMNLSRRSVS